MKIVATDKPDRQADEHIISQTRQHNAQFVPNDFTALSVYCRDDDDLVIGGLTGKTYWNYLDIEFLWVHEEHRKCGIASRIIKAAEAQAIARQCKYAMLDTYEFQALGFYLKQGYEQFGELCDYDGQYSRHYLKKRLVK